MSTFKPAGLITTDLHLTDKEEDAYRFELFDWIIDKYDQEISYVFILGDLTDRKNYHSDRLVNKLADYIEKLALCFEVLILRGNHDTDADPDTPYFKFLNKIPHVTFFDKPKLWYCDDKNWKVLFLPHAREPGKNWKLKNRKNLSAIFLHQTFKGAKSESGFALGGIGTKPFKHFDCPIFSGDVHVPQQVGPIEYVGAPYHVHYGDKYNPRVVLVDQKFRTKDDHFPAPRLFTFDLRHADLHRYKDLTKPGDRIKVRLHLPLNELGSWPEKRDKIREIATNKGLVVTGITLKQLDVKEESEPDIRKVPKRRTRQDVFASYCSINQLGKELTSAGETLLEDL